jgi:hypothetical protein
VVVVVLVLVGAVVEGEADKDRSEEAESAIGEDIASSSGFS